MQIFWVSSSVGEIKSINLTIKSLAMWVGLAVVTLISLGIITEYARMRLMAGGHGQGSGSLSQTHVSADVESLQKQISDLNQLYHTRLSEAKKQADATQQLMKEQLLQIQKQADISFQKAQELEIANQKLALIATPPAFMTDKQKNTGLGGPYRPEIKVAPGANLADSLNDTLEALRARNNFMLDAAAKWEQKVFWLRHRPTGIPVENNVSISSPFGTRIDPITNTLSLHTGLDFQASMGTSIRASGAGVVEKAGWDSEYGNEVIINHGDGVMTRYAHASQLLVKAGDTVERLQVIAKSGNTGRTTGPHLHFEVIQNNRAIDPAKVLLGLAR